MTSACVYCQRSATVRRYAPTHVDSDGLRTLTREAQGRATFATDEEATAWIVSAIASNPLADLESLFGRQAIGTFEAWPVECWARHFDPVGVYLDEESKAHALTLPLGVA